MTYRENMNYKTIIGLCEAILDINVTLARQELGRLLDTCGLNEGVQFVDGSAFRKHVKHLEKNYRHALSQAPGGPVSNTLYAMGTRLSVYPRQIRLVWRGPYSPIMSYQHVDPLSSLRRVGVTTECHPASSSRTSGSICFVDFETGEAIAVVVGPRTHVDSHAVGSNENDLNLIKLSDLCHLFDIGGVPEEHFAVVTADHHNLEPAEIERLKSLSAAGRLPFMFGRLAEFRDLRLIVEDSQVGTVSNLPGTEIVATSEGRPVTILQPGDGNPPLSCPVETLRLSEGSYLGAGDAYAGGYLAARLTGSDSASAHLSGTGEARLVSYSNSARRDYSANLTELFGSYIGRRSNVPDWDLVNRVRQSAGLSVISCGQTGIDQLALTTGQKWGLATFAIMPDGRRTERLDYSTDGEDNFGTASVIELGSTSYRYCTWANVFLADGTILLDYAGSEGSAETRRACRVLGRPLLELKGVDPSRLVETVAAWVRRHGVRVVHVAGNRASGLGTAELAAACQYLDLALRAAASCFGILSTKRFIETGQPEEEQQNPLLWRIGFPRLEEVRDALTPAIFNQPNPSYDKAKLTFRTKGGEVCFAKSADLVTMLDRGILDAAFVGSDMLREHVTSDVRVVGLSGLFNALLAVVSPSTLDLSPASVVSQYPAIAESYFRDQEVTLVPIHGAAEAWVGLGAFDATVDTWRTGATAGANHLALVDIIGSTTLAFVINDVKCPKEAFDAGMEILETLTLGVLPPDTEDIIDSLIRDQ